MVSLSKFFLKICITGLLIISVGMGQVIQIENYANNSYWGMGQSGGALPRFSNSFWINPAHTTQSKMTFSSDFALLPAGINISNLSSKYRVNRKLAIGLGINYENYGTFTEKSLNNETLGEFTASQQQILINSSFQLSQKLSVGINAVHLSNRISNSTFGQNYLQYGFQLDVVKSTTSVAMIYSDAGISENSMMRASLTHRLKHLPLHLNIDYRHYFEFNIKNMSVGGCFNVNPLIDVTVGLNFQRFNMQTLSLGEDYIAGTSVGAVYHNEYADISLAFYEYGGLGTTTALGISYSYGEKNK